MKATLKTFTALTVVLVLSGEAGAQSNFSPMMKPNFTNLAKPNLVKPNVVKPPLIKPNGVKPINPNAVKPIVRPQIVRPAIAPRVDVSRLGKESEAQNPKKTQRQARKQSPAKQAATPTASIRELPPLPRSKPDRQAIAELPPLPRPKPNYDAGPQPEPPTIGANADPADAAGQGKAGVGQDGFPGLQDMARHIGHLAMFEEIGRIRDLQEMLEAMKAIDDAAIGGGGSGKQPGFGWEALVPDGTENAGPDHKELWRPEAKGDSAYNRDPSGDQGGNFTPPWKRGQSGGQETPGFGRTPGSARAGAGIRFGNDGSTSEDGSPSQARRTNDEPEEVESHMKDVKVESCGSGCIDFTGQNQDGEFVRGRTERTFYAGYGPGTREIVLRTGTDGQVTRQETWRSDNGRLNRTRGGVIRPPTRQPNPEDAGSGQSMPCPKTSSGCGPQSDTVLGQKRPSGRDKVSQPGKGDDQGETPGFRASVAERKGVVTNPLSPDAYQARTGGGGRGPMPKEYVTQPGVGGADRPPRP